MSGGRGARLVLAVLFLALLAGCRAPAPEGLQASGLPAEMERRLIVMVPADRPGAGDAVIEGLLADYPLALVESGDFPSLAMHGVVCEVAARHDVETVLAGLARDPRVALVQPWRRFELQSEAGADDLRSAQTNLQAMRVARAHALATGRGVRVAVVDSAVDRAHPELAARVVLARDFVGDGAAGGERHGTATAGIIAASAGDGVGIVGVAPEADLLALRGCTEQPAAPPGCSNFALARAIDFAVREGADVVNLSLVGRFDDLVARVVERALADDIIVVASAGTAAEPAFPASLPGVIAAGVAGEGGRTDVVRAPGTDVLTTAPGGGFDFASGSSVATAHVAGVGALMRERDPRLGPAAAGAYLRRAASGEERLYVDACLAVSLAASDGDAPRTCTSALRSVERGGTHP